MSAGEFDITRMTNRLLIISVIIHDSPPQTVHEDIERNSDEGSDESGESYEADSDDILGELGSGDDGF